MATTRGKDTTMKYTIWPITLDEIADMPSDLCAEAEEAMNAGKQIEAVSISLWDDAGITPKAEAATGLYLPDVGRIGIAWGADADWADAASLNEGVDLWATDSEGYAARN
jgi:hypothetical protein